MYCHANQHESRSCHPSETFPPILPESHLPTIYKHPSVNISYKTSSLQRRESSPKPFSAPVKSEPVFKLLNVAGDGTRISLIKEILVIIEKSVEKSGCRQVFVHGGFIRGIVNKVVEVVNVFTREIEGHCGMKCRIETLWRKLLCFDDGVDGVGCVGVGEGCWIWI